MKRFFGIDSTLLNETGCYRQAHAFTDKRAECNLNVLWVGKLDFRKQLSIAIEALSATNNLNIILHIVGGGDQESYQFLASNLNIKKQCIWHGVVSHSEVQKLMRESDLFFFTSVAEGTPHVVLEAISNNLPILCFNTCGQGDSVNEKVGVKIELSNPKKSVKQFAEQLNFLFTHREILKELSVNCKIRQEELSWDNKAKQMISLYKKAIQGCNVE
jgi:glycosyltransferase involved in cell wall biosynthesis